MDQRFRADVAADVDPEARRQGASQAYSVETDEVLELTLGLDRAQRHLVGTGVHDR